MTTTTTTTTSAPVPNDGPRTRAASEVSIALLDTNAFVAGVHVATAPTASAGSSGGGGAGGTTVTSSNPKCAAFVTGANGGGKGAAPGVTGYASITFQDDADPLPFLVEEITTVGTPAHTAEVLAALDGSSKGCAKVTMKIPSVGSSTMTVSSVPPPAHGDHPTAVRIVGVSGPLQGLHITLVTTGVEDAVLQLTFIQATESDIEGLTAAAVERATAVFTYVKPA
jgi:hypothetical protein